MVKNQSRRILQYSEHLWVLFIWLIAFSLPVAFVWEDNYINWSRVFNFWKMLLPYLGLFLINHYILAPYLLFNKKRLAYFISILFLVFLLSFEHFINSRNNNFNLLGKVRRVEQPARISPPPRESRLDREKKNFRPNPPRPDSERTNFRRPEHPAQLPPYINIVLVSFLILGFDSGLKATVKWSESERLKTELENENVQNQLAFLKNQISPHFFMNTLNNIHALIDIDTDEAKESIIKLSKLMRYLLYESEGENVPLSKEYEFIRSYVNLMKLRYSDKVEITLNISDNLTKKSIPPMLFTSLIENAFKHGISYKDKSFIQIDILSSDVGLEFSIKNKKFENKTIDEHSGIGVENTKKRLDLIYGSNYQMDIQQDSDIFMVTLSIPL